MFKNNSDITFSLSFIVTVIIISLVLGIGTILILFPISIIVLFFVLLFGVLWSAIHKACVEINAIRTK